MPTPEHLFQQHIADFLEREHGYERLGKGAAIDPTDVWMADVLRPVVPRRNGGISISTLRRRFRSRYRAKSAMTAAAPASTRSIPEITDDPRWCRRWRKRRVLAPSARLSSATMPRAVSGSAVARTVADLAGRPARPGSAGSCFQGWSSLHQGCGATIPAHKAALRAGRSKLECLLGSGGGRR